MVTPSRDTRMVESLKAALLQLEDFRDKLLAAEEYAVKVVTTARQDADGPDDFKDQIMGIIANVKHLEGEIATKECIAPEDLAKMDIADMRSRKQKRELALFSRKRAREQTNYERTNMMCSKCGLVRQDRININEMGLDSEENGSHFEYNYDNLCTCSHSSEEDSSSEDEEAPLKNDSVESFQEEA